MKKIFLMLIAMLMVAPMVVFAENKIIVSIPQKNDSKITTDTDQETGITKKKFPIYVVQTDATVKVERVVIDVTWKSNGIADNGINFIAESPYEMTKDGDKGTFTASEANAVAGKKVFVGYVEVTIKTSASDCSFKYEPRVNGVKTGSFVSYIALGAGVLLLGGIYVATRSKKKMYNI